MTSKRTVQQDNSYRNKMMARTIQEIVSQSFTYGKFDHIINSDQINVTNVKVSSDLHYATVEISLRQDDNDALSSVVELNKRIAPMVRKMIASQLSNRKVPQIKFALDDNLSKITSLEKLFAKIKQENIGI